MEYKESLTEAISSLKKNLLRTSLTMLGIVIGISAVILIVSVGQGAVKFVTNELSVFGSSFFGISPGSSAIASFAGGAKNLTLEDAQSIAQDKSITNIDFVIPIAIASVPVAANGVDKHILIRGVSQDALAVVRPTILSGSFISEEDYLSSSRVAVLGLDTSKDFFGEDTDPVGEIIRIDGKPFRVIGLAKSSSVLLGGSFNNTIFMPTTVVLNQILGPGSSLRQIGVKVKDPDLINQTIEDVSNILRDRHSIKEGEDDDFAIQSFQDILSTVRTITNLLTLLVAGVSGISLIVGGVGVMNIMLVSVTERTREIGLLKAIGAKQKDIIAQFLMESVVITLIGGVIGIAIGVTGALLISLFLPIPFVLNIFSIIITVGVLVLIGVGFGLYPARRAAKLSPIDALRYE
jgi:putative ABC transport system permease protein